MICKIQGGGKGVYSNSGSCRTVAEYLEHEDSKRQESGLEPEPFFDQKKDNLKYKEMIEKIDRNKGQLLKTDAKFYVLTVAPSAEELKAMGNSPQEQREALKDYVRNTVMQNYAETFKNYDDQGKLKPPLNKDEVIYFAKIHHERGNKGEGNMHAHIVVSRKDFINDRKLNPQTNHSHTEKGPVRGGFHRDGFIEKIEKGFDKQFSYNRPIKQTYEYQKVMSDKKKSSEEKKAMEMKAQKSINNQTETQKEQEKQKENQQSKNQIEL